MVVNSLRDWLRRRHQKEQQARERWRAQHLDSVNQLANLSDAELIATAPGIPSQVHQMEMNRRLKVAIQELTRETVAARKSSDKAARRLTWLNVIVVVLTAALVALTVVLAIRS